MVIRLLVVLEIRSGGPRCHQGPCSWEHECRKIKICENASCICWDVLLDKGKVWLAAGARWKARLLPRVWTGLDHLDSIVYNLSKQTNKLKWPKLQGLTNLVFSEVCTSITFQRANEVKLGLNKSLHGAFFLTNWSAFLVWIYSEGDCTILPYHHKMSVIGDTSSKHRSHLVNLFLISTAQRWTACSPHCFSESIIHTFTCSRLSQLFPEKKEKGGGFYAEL